MCNQLNELVSQQPTFCFMLDSSFGLSLFGLVNVVYVVVCYLACSEIFSCFLGRVEYEIAFYFLFARYLIIFD